MMNKLTYFRRNYNSSLQFSDSEPKKPRIKISKDGEEQFLSLVKIEEGQSKPFMSVNISGIKYKLSTVDDEFNFLQFLENYKTLNKDTTYSFTSFTPSFSFKSSSTPSVRIRNLMIFFDIVLGTGEISAVEFDVDNNTYTTVSTVATGKTYRSPTIQKGADGFIYLVIDTHLYKYDTALKVFERISATVPVVSGLITDMMISPHDRNVIIVKNNSLFTELDLKNSTLSTFGSSDSYTYLGSVIARNKKIYSFTTNSSTKYMVCYNPETKEIIKKNSGVDAILPLLHKSGEIFCLTSQGGGKILKFNQDTEMLETTVLSQISFTDGSFKTGIMVGANGSFFVIGNYSIWEFRPDDMTAVSLSTSEINAMFSPYSSNGELQIVSRSGRTSYKIKFDVDVTPTVLFSPYIK